MKNPLHLKGKALENFARACRRVALPLAMGLSALPSAGQSENRDLTAFNAAFEREMQRLGGSVAETPQATRGQESTQKARKAISLESLSQAERDQANETLRASARAHFLYDIAAGQPVSNGYSRQLDSLRAVMTPRIQALQGKDQNLTFIDPLLVDIGASLGLTNERIARDVSEFSGIYPNGNRQALASSFLDGRMFNGIDTMDIQRGAAMWEDAGHIIIPASAAGDGTRVREMSLRKNSLQTNLHELFHALDTARLNPNVQQLSMEMFADLGACGERIRQGEPVSIIDMELANRDAQEYNTTHMTSGALRDLRQLFQNEDLLKYFRKISFEQTLPVYYKIVAAQQAQHAGEMAGAEAQGGHHHDHGYGTPAEANSISPEAVARIQAELGKWSPWAEMEDLSFKRYGKMTAETLYKAYAEIQDGIYMDARDKTAPEDIVRGLEKMRILKASLMTAMQETDFLAVNARHGVKLLETEKSLNSFIAGLQDSRQETPAQGRTLDLTGRFTP